MRKICVINQKGGVGKTTTSINLAAGLSRHGKKVLLVDLDPQGNINTSLRINNDNDLYRAMTGEIEINSCISNVAKNFDAITSKENLVKAEFYLSQQKDSRFILKELLHQINGYDFIIIDCPPSLGILNQNALSFCTEAFVPVSTDYLGFDALMKMKEIVKDINDNYNHDIRISLVVPTMFSKRSKICKETLKDITNHFPLFTADPIRMNVKLREAPKKGKSIFSYAKSSPGAKDYQKLVDEVLTM